MKKTSLALSLLLATSTLICTTADSNANEANTNRYPFQYVENSKLLKDMKQYEQSKVQFAREPQRPQIPNLGLDDNKLLNYIWEKSQKNDFSYEMLLAIAKVESDMNKDEINHNTNGSRDLGLYQVNSINIRWLCDDLNIKHYNPKDVYQNVDLAVRLLVYERDFWRGQGMSEEEVFDATILSYHLGRGNTISHIRKFGFNSKYLDAVRHYKNLYEQSEVTS